MSNSFETLPPWFRKPHSAEAYQLSLFPDTLSEVMAQLRINIDELDRWYEKKWLSFNPQSIEEIEMPLTREITFIRDIVRSGLSDAYIEQLFSQLPRPLRYDPHKIAYSFNLGWVEAFNPDPSQIIEDNLESWLDDLIDYGDPDKLEHVTSLLTGFFTTVIKRYLEVRE